MGESERISRRERERERHREEIMEAALRVFSQKGYQDTSIQEIAQEAEFAVGTLYNFFPGKEQLFEAVALKVGEDMLEILGNTLAARENPLEGLLEASVAITALIRERREVLMLFLGTMPRHMAPLSCQTDREAFRAIHDNWYARIHDCFARAVDQGLIKPLDPGWYTVSFIGLASAWFWQAVSDPGAFPPETASRLVRELFFESILLKALP